MKHNMLTQIANDAAEKGLVPDAVLRSGIRKLLQQRLQEIQSSSIENSANQTASIVKQMQSGAIAIQTDKANEQHYEVPSDYYIHALGPQRKYSCAYWSGGIQNLADAESNALTQTCEHAEIQNGMSILELGCGWGSLTLHIAEYYPNSQVVAVSNSSSQKAYIESQATLRGLSNITVKTIDMNDFETTHKFDRVLSIEMFEHMRNWPALYQKISKWLDDDGKFFKHIFVHRNTPYFFEDNDATDWMTRYFFAGGLMPSADLPLFFQGDLIFENRWMWDGRHYEKTCNAWLDNMDVNMKNIWPIFEQTYGKDFTRLWWMRWRMFYMACAELFGYNHGQEWFVGHYLFSKR